MSEKDPPESHDIPESHDLPEHVGIYGDVNRDGKITAQDSLLILRYTIGLKKLDDIQMILANVNGDSRVTAADSLEVLRYSVKLKSKGVTGEKAKI